MFGFSGFLPSNLNMLLLIKVPNTVFVRALADAIQGARNDCKQQTCHQYSDYFICSMLALSVLFFFIIERSALIVLVFYYRGMP